jgi:hypothetical protein
LDFIYIADNGSFRSRIWVKQLKVDKVLVLFYFRLYFLLLIGVQICNQQLCIT